MSIVQKFQVLVVGVLFLTMIALSGGMAHADETEEYVPFAWLFTDNLSFNVDDQDFKSESDYSRWEEGRAEGAFGSSVQVEGPIAVVFGWFTATKEAVSPIMSPCFDSETRVGNVRTNVNIDVDPNFEDYSIKARLTFSRRDNDSAGCS